MGFLQDPELKDAIMWNGEGTAFCVVPKRFINLVLKHRGQGSKFGKHVASFNPGFRLRPASYMLILFALTESFTRKLNRWGFKRVADDFFPRGAVVYKHNLFLRDKPKLLVNMSGTTKKEPTASATPKEQTAHKESLNPQATREPMLAMSSILPSSNHASWSTHDEALHAASRRQHLLLQQTSSLNTLGALGASPLGLDLHLPRPSVGLGGPLANSYLSQQLNNELLLLELQQRRRAAQLLGSLGDYSLSHL